MHIVSHRPPPLASPRGDEPSRRREDVDALRGLAVLLMIAWHCADAWLAPAARGGASWAGLRIAGGLAAPLFLILAGASVGLALKRSSGSLGAIVRRGLSLVVLGWVLRLQIWLVDCGAVFDPRAWPTAIAGLAGCAVALLALRDGPRDGTDRQLRDRRPQLAIAFVLLAFAAGSGSFIGASHVLLRVDVLSCVGASIVLCAWLSRVSPPALVLAAVALALVAGPARELVTGSPAPALTAWVAQPHDDVGAALAGFPIVPWLAYALLGCAAARRAGDRAIPTAALIAMGATIAIVAFEGGLPWTRRALHAMPWLRPMARLAWHAGAASVALGVVRGLGRWLPRALLAHGRSSLATYWAHLSIVFGVVSAPLHRALELDAWLGALSLLVASMTLLAVVLDRRRSLRATFDEVLRRRTSSRATAVSSPNPRA